MAYSVIKKPSDYFNTVTYTGNNTTNAITGVGFQPDWTWIKPRNGTDGHVLIDSVRGVLKRLRTEGTNAEDTLNNSLTSFDTDGFTLGSSGEVNSSSYNLVSWNWLASNTTASNTDGSITSTVSANTTSGFSIVSYTGNETAGATVGHGLSSTPKMIILKNRNSTDDWVVYHESLGNTQSIRLNLTNASATTPASFNNTSPTSSVFTLGDWTAVNGSSMIAYCFAEVKGFSKFGSYVGNGNADGTFVYTGFKPAFVLIKNITTAGEHWHMADNKRDTDNAVSKWLLANANGAEFTIDICDFVSNGFKIRTGSQGTNQSGASFIYMAFADEPLVGDNPATAR